VLIAEVLLHQTDSKRVSRIYNSFINRFPTASVLAEADVRSVRKQLLSLGLAYRARRLKELARTLVRRYDGNVPSTFEALIELPGVGPYVARATLCFAFTKPAPLLDVNFARVYRRFYGVITYDKRPDRDRVLLELATASAPRRDVRNFGYALLDFAATVCTENDPRCRCCPLRRRCATKPNVRSKAPIALDVFAGAGGLSLGAKMAGIDVAYGIEADKNAARTYQENFNRTPVATTVITPRAVRSLCDRLGIRPGDMDLLLAGPPCQGFSISNLRTRHDQNPANHAWKSVIVFLRYLRPKAIVLENVGGIETYEGGKVASRIEEVLEQLGYSTNRFRLDAADFGVPQHRTRIFFVGVRGGAVSAIPKGHSEPITVAMALRDLPRVPNGNRDDTARYRTYGRALGSYQKQMRRRMNGVVANCQTSNNTHLITERFALVPQGGNWSSIPTSKFTTYARRENCHRWLYRRLREDRPSVTISNFRKNMLIHPWQDRTLSVREAARLQGLMDHFRLFGNLQSQQQQVANAVPPAVAKAVVKEVVRALGAYL
jgi:DNA (cytosine-5)-methyltransferase 1